MAEVTTKKRAWVKNAIIIFLIIMLILTFFSNTIMNAALPEVAALYAQPGTITSKIRATSEIKANMTYNVVAENSREVEAVAIKQGDAIEAGGVLFYLKDEESVELQEAQKTLDTMQLAYDKALLSLPVPDYSPDERAIANLQEDLAKLQADFNSIASGEQKVEALKAAMDRAELAANAAADYTSDMNDALTELTAQQNELAENDEGLKAIRKEVEAAKKQLDTAKKNLEEFSAADNSEQVQADLNQKNKDLEDQNIQLKRLKEDYDIAVSQNNSALAALQNQYNAALSKLQWLESSQPPKYIQVPAENPDEAPVQVTNEEYQNWLAEYNAALAELQAAQDSLNNFSAPADTLSASRAIEDQELLISRTSQEILVLRSKLSAASSVKAQKQALQNTVDTAQANYDTLSEKYDNATKVASESLAQQIKEAKTRVKNAERSQKAAESAFSDATEAYNEAKMEVPGADAAKEAITAKQREIESARETLAQKKAEDLNKAALDNLDIQAQARELENQQAKVEKLKSDGTGATVVSPYAGTVSSVSVVAGDTMPMGSTVAVIEVTEKGYSMEFPVTNEQAKLIRPGDKASLSGWWYADAEITVASMKNDPANPGKGKIVVCNVTGDVTVGQSLSIVLGERGANYDIIVPNSAVREDANGSYVLIVESKSSPLGNRYVATRADVTVLASDDTQSAISGALYGYEFVITTSTKPVEAGQLVRLAEN